jgi:hypothetical protein
MRLMIIQFWKRLEVAKTFRVLAKTNIPLEFGKSLADFWRKRAEECRTVAETFKSKVCREQLSRLADTYDYIADGHEQD